MHVTINSTPTSTYAMAENMDLLDSMLDLTRRLPPMNIEENVSSLVELCPDYADELLGSVDQPLKLRTDRATGRDYLICDYNRDGESYRYTFIYAMLSISLD
jgi:capping protein beta